MKESWLLGTVVFVLVCAAGMIFTKRRGFEYQAQVVATVLAFGILVLLSLWATGSDYMLESRGTDRPLKTVLFAFSAGWCAQIILGLDKLINAPKQSLGVISTALLRPLLGGLTGVAAALLKSGGHFDTLGDEAAIGFGLVGGAAGILVLDIRNKFFFKPETQGP